MKGVKHCGCLIHCRRYFVNALPKEKKAHPSSVAVEAVRYFDRIYHEEGLLKEGEITEQGTHAELMALKGIYFKLVELQQLS